MQRFIGILALIVLLGLFLVGACAMFRDLADVAPNLEQIIKGLRV